MKKQVHSDYRLEVRLQHPGDYGFMFWSGAKWTEGDSPHNGGCCAKDCEVFDAMENAKP